MSKKKTSTAIETKKLDIIKAAGVEESVLWDFLAERDEHRTVVESLADKLENGEITAEELKAIFTKPGKHDVIVNDYPDAYEIDYAFGEDGRMSFEKCVDMFPNAVESELKRVVGITNALLDIQERQSGLVQRTAYLLWALETTGAHKAIGYKSVATYAKEVLGINSKGSVSDAISTFQRFGDKSAAIDWEAETAGKIKSEYEGFNFSTLMRMKKLTDDEIAEMGITPDMSRSQVVQTINETLAANAKKLKEDKEKQKMLDGSVEDEIEKEIKEESSTVEPNTGGDAETEISDMRVALFSLPYTRGQNLDDYINTMSRILREHMQAALDNHTDSETFLFDVTLLKDVRADE